VIDEAGDEPITVIYPTCSVCGVPRIFDDDSSAFDDRDLPAVVTVEAVSIEYLWRGEFLGGLGGTNTDAPEFVAAMEELIELASRRHVAIMCSERAPQDCHRQTKLGTWAARERGVTLTHILPGAQPAPVQKAQRGLFDT